MKKKLLAIVVAGALAAPAYAFAALAAPFRDRPAFMKRYLGPAEHDGSPVFPGHFKAAAPRILPIEITKSFNTGYTKLIGSIDLLARRLKASMKAFKDAKDHRGTTHGHRWVTVFAPAAT